MLRSDKPFIPAHKNFRVIAIAAPSPPYPGYPIDPPFRSRFQARFCDPVGSLVALNRIFSEKQSSSSPPILQKVRDIILSTQYASESRDSLETVSKSLLPAFPQTALVKLNGLVALFPPPVRLSPGQLARLFLTLHPGLVHTPFQAWAMLNRQTEESGIGELGSLSMIDADENIGLFGYRVIRVERENESKARVFFDGPTGTSLVAITVPAGPREFRPFPFTGKLEFRPTQRFMGLLTCFLQAHALGWDISLTPPALLSTASSSTSTLVKVFGEILGYETESVHMYKELGGRELIMRRRVEDSGATTWEPRSVVVLTITIPVSDLMCLRSPLVEAAWTGRLLHLAGLDVIGATAGSLARLVQDREVELWEGKRIVSAASAEEVTLNTMDIHNLLTVIQISSGELSVAHPSFRIISTASKSLPLKDWLNDEHANMFFPIPSQPMDAAEEAAILLETGCSPTIIKTLLSFAEKYRQSLSADTVQKNRKLGTRSLVRIATRLAKFPQDNDLNRMISRSLLAEFLPAIERMNLDTLLQEAGMTRRSAWVCSVSHVMLRNMLPSSIRIRSLIHHP